MLRLNMKKTLTEFDCKNICNKYKYKYKQQNPKCIRFYSFFTSECDIVGNV